MQPQSLLNGFRDLNVYTDGRTEGRTTWHVQIGSTSNQEYILYSFSNFLLRANGLLRNQVYPFTLRLMGMKKRARNDAWVFSL